MKVNPFKIALTPAVVCGLALASGIIAFPAHASDLDKEVRMTFSAPFEIPGHVLPAGTYIFRRWYMSGNPNAMFVYDANEKLIGTVMTLPTYENDAPPQFNAGGGDAQSHINVKFDERKANNDQALRSWNYPGDPTGFKLVYPKESPTPIPSTVASNVPRTLPAGPEPPQQAGAEPAPASPAPAVTPATVQEEQVIIAQNNPPPAPEAPEQPAPQVLPQTASPYPSFGFAGLLAFVLFGLVKRVA